MSSFSHRFKQPSNKPQSKQITYKNAFDDINDNNEYEIAPQIQQYNFGGSFSPRQSQQIKEGKKSSLVRESKLQQRDSRVKETKDADIVRGLKREIQGLERENRQLKQDREQLIKRIQQLELKIEQLTKSLSFEKNKHSDYQENFQSSLSNKKSLSKKLSKQNSLSAQSPSSSRNKSLSSSPILLKELLLQCNQSREFDEVKNNSIQTKHTSRSRKDPVGSRWDRDEFYEYKNTRDCFSPFYEHLSRELQLRCKKAMIREKELNYKDDFVEIGCISRKVDDLQFQLNLVITNLQFHPIKNVNVAYLYKGDIQLNKQVKSTNLTVEKSTKDHTVYAQLNSAEQIKEYLSVRVHAVDFRCVLVSLEFTDSRAEQHKVTQILPACKHRLFNYLVATPIPPTYLIMEKVIIFDKKFIPDLQKLKSYYKSVHFTTDRHKNVQGLLKIEFLSKHFFVTFKLLGVDKLTIGVHHPQNESQLGQKILAQFTFIFQR